MPWLTALGVRFSSSAASLKLKWRPAASNNRKVLSGGKRYAMNRLPSSPELYLFAFQRQLKSNEVQVSHMHLRACPACIRFMLRVC
jgi:hypothetical protein